MRQIFKKLAVAATATALVGAIGASVAQTEESNRPDGASAQQEVVVPANASGQEIYFFRDQGNSPESDPAAHLLLIKHQQMVPVSETTSTTTTTVAQSTPSTDTTTTTAMPAASDTSNTDTAASNTTSSTTDTTPMLAPKADRN